MTNNKKFSNCSSSFPYSTDLLLLFPDPKQSIQDIKTTTEPVMIENFVRAQSEEKDDEDKLTPEEKRKVAQVSIFLILVEFGDHWTVLNTCEGSSKGMKNEHILFKRSVY